MTLCWRIKCCNAHGQLKHKFLCSCTKPASLSLAPGASPTDSSRMKSLRDWCMNFKYLSLFETSSIFSFAWTQSDAGVFLLTTKYKQPWNIEWKCLKNPAVWQQGEAQKSWFWRALHTFCSSSTPPAPNKVSRNKCKLRILQWCCDTSLNTQASIHSIYSCHAFKRSLLTQLVVIKNSNWFLVLFSLV